MRCAAIAAGKHIVMVNVEADVLAGPLLARKARERRRRLFAWPMATSRRSSPRWSTGRARRGFEVVAAGKGTKYLPAYHDVTPDDVWAHYGLTPEEAKRAGMNPQMFNSFLDGTKSAIEMAAIANACGLDVPAGRPCSSRPAASTTCRTCCGRATPAACWSEPAWSRSSPRWSATAGRCSATCAGASTSCFKAPNDYAAACFKQYGLTTDASGRYAAMYKPYHLIGLELSISVLNAGAARRADRRDRATGAATSSRSPSAPLKAGEMLDGEGGYTVYGKLMPAARSLAEGALPIGLAHRVKLKNDIAHGAVVTLERRRDRCGR